jgi:hypothetical protein
MVLAKEEITGKLDGRRSKGGLKEFSDAFVEKGEKRMKSRFVVFLVTLFLLFTWLTSSPATVEWDVASTLNLKEKARDAAMSLNGRWIYVLTYEGEILIYSSNGKLEDTISVGKSVEGIKVGQREDVLLLTSGKDKTVQLITLDFIQEINVSGSPFKGNADAPVAVATFNDFQ